MLANLVVHPSGYNGNQSQQGVQWTQLSINHRLTNHRPERLSQNATALSGAWEGRHAIPECINPDRLSQDALQICTE